MRVSASVRRCVWVLTAVALVLLTAVPGPVGGSAPGSPGNPVPSGAALATLTIYPDGSVSTAGILSVSGNTYTLMAPYTGSIADERNQSVLDGANLTLSCATCQSVLYVYQATHVTVQNFRIVSNIAGIAVQQSSDVLVAGNFVAAATSDVIDVTDSTGVTVSNNDGSDGYGFYASNVSDLLVEGNNFSNSRATGVDLFATSLATVEGNDASGANTYPFYMDETYGTVIDQNDFSRPGGGVAAYLISATAGNFSHNDLSGAIDPIQIETSNNLSLWNNTVSPGVQVGAYILQSGDITLGDTQAVGAVYAGVEITLDSGVTLIGMDLRVAYYGVVIDSSSGVAILDSLLGSGSTSISVDRSSNISIRGSDLTNPNNGLVAFNSSRIVVVDSNLSRANYPVYLTAHTDDVLVENSDLNGAQLAAVYTDNSSRITIDHSSLRGASPAGVLSTRTQQLTVSWCDLSGTALAPRSLGISTREDSGVVLENDTITWTDHPFIDIGSKGIRIADTDFSNATNGWYGAAFSDDSGISVTASDFRFDTGVGLSVDRGYDVSIRGSHFDHVQFDGVTASYVHGLELTGNSFDAGGDVGVYVDNTVGVVGTGNSASDTFYGFFFQSTASIVLTNNVARNDSGSSVAVTNGLPGLTLSGNDFSNDTDPGALAVTIDSVLDFSVVGNDFTRDSLGLWIGGTAVGSVVGNRFVDCNTSFWIDGTISAAVSHNDFVRDGGWHLYDIGASTWNRDYPVGGNYWSNDTGPDAMGGPLQDVPGADGLVDLPLALVGSNVDQYPLTTAWASHVVVFVEGGLATGTPWGIVFNGTSFSSASSSITVLAAVGVASPYAFTIDPVSGYDVTPGSGNGMMGLGAVTVTIVYTAVTSTPPVPSTYTVDFVEAGLPSGTSWSVVLNGTTVQSANTTARFVLLNGTYPFELAALAGYSVQPPSGTVVVAGLDVTMNVAYRQVTYSLNVIELGLPFGAVWSVSVGGTTTPVLGTALSLSLPNGTYEVAPVAVTSYDLSPTSTNVTVDGGPVTLYVVYSVIPPTATHPGPLPTLTETQSTLVYWGAIVALAVAAAAGWLLALRRRRPGASALPATNLPAAPEPTAAPPPPPPTGNPPSPGR